SRPTSWGSDHAESGCAPCRPCEPYVLGARRLPARVVRNLARTHVGRPRRPPRARDRGRAPVRVSVAPVVSRSIETHPSLHYMLCLRESLTMTTYTPAQAEAIACVDRPLQIIACAGSGKTQVISQRIAAILAQPGAKPRNVIAFTFTEKAAAELKER